MKTKHSYNINTKLYTTLKMLRKSDYPKEVYKAIKKELGFNYGRNKPIYIYQLMKFSKEYAMLALQACPYDQHELCFKEIKNFMWRYITYVCVDNPKENNTLQDHCYKVQQYLKEEIDFDMLIKLITKNYFIHPLIRPATRAIIACKSEWIEMAGKQASKAIECYYASEIYDNELKQQLKLYDNG